MTSLRDATEGQSAVLHDVTVLPALRIKLPKMTPVVLLPTLRPVDAEVILRMQRVMFFNDLRLQMLIAVVARRL
jgi:hypothetical protein